MRAPGPFAKPVADAVHLPKYSDRRSVARNLAAMMAAAAGADASYRNADVMLAVPLHAARQRQENVKDIFRVRRPPAVRDKTVILVEDVLTTGATIGSCGQALLLAGAARVLALTAAAAPLA